MSPWGINKNTNEVGRAEQTKRGRMSIESKTTFKNDAVVLLIMFLLEYYLFIYYLCIFVL